MSFQPGEGPQAPNRGVAYTEDARPSAHQGGAATVIDPNESARRVLRAEVQALLVIAEHVATHLAFAMHAGTIRGAHDGAFELSVAMGNLERARDALGDPGDPYSVPAPLPTP